MRSQEAREGSERAHAGSARTDATHRLFPRTLQFERDSGADFTLQVPCETRELYKRGPGETNEAV